MTCGFAGSHRTFAQIRTTRWDPVTPQMSMLHFAREVLCATAFLAAASTGNSQVVLLGNYPSNGSPGTAIAADGTRAAEVFTMPAAAYNVNSVTVPLTDFYGSPELVSLGFYTDGGSGPGSLVGSLLTQPAGSGYNGSPLTDYTFTAGSTVTLAANTTYWMVLGVPAGFVGWGWSNSLGTGLATFDHQYASGNNGATYGIDQSINFAYQINASAIPEPSTYAAMAAAASLAFAAWRRRRVRGSAPVST
jgi:hypothetical protein